MKRTRTIVFTVVLTILFGLVFAVFLQDRLTPPPTPLASEDEPAPADALLIYNINDTAVLFTPQYGIFSSDHLKRLGYTQPHILLKGELT